MPDEQDYVQADLRVAEFMRMPRESRHEALDRSSTQEGAPAWLDCARGEDFRSEGDLLLAVEAFARAVQQDPDSPLARAPLLFFLTKGERRLRGLRALAERWPGIGRVRLYLGAALVVCHRAQEALEEYSEATKSLPEDPSLWGAIAWAHMSIGNLTQAADAAERMLALAPQSPRVHSAAARILYRCRRHERAFAVARQSSRRFHGVRRWLLRWTLPVSAAELRTRISVFLFTWIFVAAALYEIPAGEDLHLAVATLCVAVVILGWQALAAYADGTLRLVRKSRALHRKEARLLAELQLDAHES